MKVVQHFPSAGSQDPSMNQPREKSAFCVWGSMRFSLLALVFLTSVSVDAADVTRPTTKATKASSASEPDAAGSFNTTFGADLTKVGSTPSSKDDLELALRIFDTGRRSAQSPAFQFYCYQRFIDLSAKEGSTTFLVLEAIEHAERLQPAAVATLEEKAIQVCDRMLKASIVSDRPIFAKLLLRRAVMAAERLASIGKLEEALQAAKRGAEAARLVGTEEAAGAGDLVRQLTALQITEKRISDLKKRFEAASAEPPAIRELTELTASVVDRPREALYYARLEGRQEWVPILELATTPPAKLNAEALLQLAGFHRTTGDRLTGASQAAAYRRAEVLYARFLAGHLKQDSDRQRAAAAMQALLVKAEKSGCFELSLPGLTFDRSALTLLPRVAFDRHRLAGPWQRRGTALNADASSERALISLPAMPSNDYELAIEYTSDGSSAIGVTVPIGSSAVTVMRYEASCGLANVGKKWIGFPAVLPDLRRDSARHLLHVKVSVAGDQGSLILHHDGVEAGRWTGAAADLAPLSGAEIPAPAKIGLYARDGRVTWHAADIVANSGRIELLSLPANPQELPWDGSRPISARVDVAEKVAIFAHNLVTLTFDNTLPTRKVTLAFDEPNEECRRVRRGFLQMMSAPGNLEPLRMDMVRYRFLIDLTLQAPKGFAAADSAGFELLFRDFQDAITPEAKVRAERQILVNLHLLGERYRLSSATWAARVRQTLSPAEAKLMSNFAQ